MAFCGIFLASIRSELTKYINARVDKIHQVTKDEIYITLRSKAANVKLFISASSVSPRVHISNISIENPKSPPMFCMLLRKHLGSGKIINIRQQELDRILFIDFETVNELGDICIMTLAIEIMGKHSNIILINENGKIIDSIKRVSEDVSGVRPILPGMTYTLPPTQNKHNILTLSKEEILDLFIKSPIEDISKCIMNLFYGFYPTLADEITFYILGGMPLSKKQLVDIHYERFNEIFMCLKDNISKEEAEIFISYKDKKPFSFMVIPIKQYGDFLEVKSFFGPSLAIDEFYIYREQNTRMKQRANDLLKVVLNKIDRNTSKIAVWKEELISSKNRDLFKEYGDLLNSNLFLINKGDKTVELDNFFDPEFKKITIPLDEKLTPQQNAQKYYNKYKKSLTAEKMLTELISDTEIENEYLDSTWDLITRTNNEAEVNDIRKELGEQGIIRLNRSKKDKLTKPTLPLKYKSSDDFIILCGRNNLQNDKLTLKDSKNYDMWLHVQKIAGSHVVILSENTRQITNKTIEEAAIIAAYNSKARNSALVPVDYTLIKNVKKPNKAKPGMVIFTNYQTAYVTPNEEFVKSLEIK